MVIAVVYRPTGHDGGTVPRQLGERSTSRAAKGTQSFMRALATKRILHCDRVGVARSLRRVRTCVR